MSLSTKLYAIAMTLIEENVMTQLENLRTYPIIHSKLHKGEINLYGWVYKIETGGVFVYTMDRCNIQAEYETIPYSEVEPMQVWEADALLISCLPNHLLKKLSASPCQPR